MRLPYSIDGSRTNLISGALKIFRRLPSSLRTSPVALSNPVWVFSASEAGMANNPALQNINLDPKQFAHIKAIIYSMTPEERENPDMMNPSRRRRLAAGSGRPIVEVNRMIKQFNQMRKMMRQVTNGNLSGMENLMGGQMPGGRLGKLAMNRMARQMKKNKKKRLKKKKR